MVSGSLPAANYPSFDLHGTNRSPEFFADCPRLTDQCGRLKTMALVGCTLKRRQNFAVQAAMVLFSAFFQLMVQVLPNILQRKRRHVEIKMVPVWMSTVA
jgi:hypothetical protein